MRKPTLLLALTLAAAVPAFAAQDRSHSYFTYDDGGTIVRQGDDGRETEARVNFPVFPGDEVTTSRRGRAEIRLADGNVLALDRSTSVRFRSILDSYDGDSAQTVVELRYGHAAVQRASGTREMLRLDTQNASYAATGEAIYAVEADSSRAQDRVVVFDGAIEVRTPTRTTRLREGEQGRVDNQGLYDLVSERNTDDFEQWFLRRTNRARGASSRYLDRSLAYYDNELSTNGSWHFVATLGSWSWRPYVGAGWRPYYSGRWVSGPSGCLVWASYEPWGWVPYHYGRWAYEPLYGWVWLPGASYAPAWVYWMYGPSYIGWAPMGWYDCYRPYYDWAYRPYARAGFGYGYGGFYGRVNVGNVDLRPWTFMEPRTLVSHRVDQAAISTEIIRGRLLRGDGQFATVSGAPARFNRNEIKDPTSAINVIARRGVGSGTGNEGSGVATDMTPFFRRDPELSNSIRERIVRSRVVDSKPGASLAAPVGAPSGIPTPGTPGTLEGRVGRDSNGRTRSEVGGGGGVVDRGSAARDANTWRRDSSSTPPPADRGSVRRDPLVRAPATSPSDPGAVSRDRQGSVWRDRIGRATPPSTEQSPTPAPADRSPGNEWRGRAAGRRGSDGSGGSGSATTPGDRGSEVPRRIIDGIGGAHIRESAPRDNAPSRESAPPRYVPRDTAPSRESAPPRYVPRESNPPRDSGRVERSSPPPSSERSSPPPRSESQPRSHDSGSGRVKRD